MVADAFQGAGIPFVYDQIRCPLQPAIDPAVLRAGPQRRAVSAKCDEIVLPGEVILALGNKAGEDGSFLQGLSRRGPPVFQQGFEQVVIPEDQAGVREPVVRVGVVVSRRTDQQPGFVRSRRKIRRPGERSQRRLCGIEISFLQSGVVCEPLQAEQRAGRHCGGAGILKLKPGQRAVEICGRHVVGRQVGEIVSGHLDRGVQIAPFAGSLIHIRKPIHRPCLPARPRALRAFALKRFCCEQRSVGRIYLDRVGRASIRADHQFAGPVGMAQGDVQEVFSRSIVCLAPVLCGPDQKLEVHHVVHDRDAFPPVGDAAP